MTIRRLTPCLILLLAAAPARAAAGLFVAQVAGSLSVAAPGKAPAAVTAADPKTPLPLGASVRVSGGAARFSAPGLTLTVPEGGVFLAGAVKGKPQISLVSGSARVEAGGNSLALTPGASVVVGEDGTMTMVSGRADGPDAPLYAGETLKPAPPSAFKSILIPLSQ